MATTWVGIKPCGCVTAGGFSAADVGRMVMAGLRVEKRTGPVALRQCQCPPGTGRGDATVRARAVNNAVIIEHAGGGFEAVFACPDRDRAEFIASQINTAVAVALRDAASRPAAPVTVGEE